MENFEYIKSNIWKEEYQNEEKNKNEKKGLQESKCKGSITISHKEQIASEVPHNDHDSLTENETMVLKFKILVK
ncbi:unnamed protein product [Brachionus calyciflorus]|uniref:Uncharacterized protein n=1 Tax=Brachionus calyciflorus TaxID=104777 RepID=A0A813N0R6_9BILA|nr:unnamed protein product [Brachionus calyciflorus]